MIDATNAVGEGGPLNALAVLTAHAPGDWVYRAFNSLGWENFAEPEYDGVAGDLLHTGPAADQEAVERLIRDVGLRPIRVCDNDRIDLVDNLTRPWFALAFEQGYGRGMGLKILTR